MSNVLANTNIVIILSVTLALVLIGCVVYLKTASKSKLDKLVIDAIKYAEDSFGPGKGEIKKQAAITYVMAYMPPLLKPFITVKLIDTVIESIFSGLLSTFQNKYKQDLAIETHDLKTQKDIAT